ALAENLRYPNLLAGGRLDVAPDLTSVENGTGDRLLAFQADASRPLAASTRLDMGYRLNLRRYENAQDVERFVADAGAPPAAEEGHRYEYDEDSHAVYANLDQRWGRMGVQGGLRYERVSGVSTAPSLIPEFSVTHDDVFPSVNVSYDFGEGRQV